MFLQIFLVPTGLAVGLGSSEASLPHSTSKRRSSGGFTPENSVWFPGSPDGDSALFSIQSFGGFIEKPRNVSNRLRNNNETCPTIAPGVSPLSTRYRQTVSRAAPNQLNRIGDKSAIIFPPYDALTLDDVPWGRTPDISRFPGPETPRSPHHGTTVI